MDNLNQFSKVIAQVSDLLAPLAGDSEGSFDPASFELTYNEDRHYDGKLYSIAIPDGFVFDRKESGRDFHAWLPNPENPQEEYMALVSIKPSVEIDLPDTGFEIRTPRLLHAVFSLVMVATASALATDPLMKNSKNLQLTLGDLETHCNYLPDPVSAHFYVNICMHGKFKQFRIDMRGVTEKNEAASLALVQKILMKVELKEPPFQPLKKLTDASYTESPLTEKAVREWAELLNTYLDQENKAFMVNTRTMEQEVPQRAKEGVLAPEWIDEEAARIRKGTAREVERIFADTGEFLDAVLAKNLNNQVLLGARSAVMKQLDTWKEVSLTLNNKEEIEPIRNNSIIRSKWNGREILALESKGREERERRTKQEQERREREERERRAREEEERRKQEERKQRKEKERLKMDLASFMGEMDRPVSLAEIMQQPRFRSLGSTQVLSLLSELCKLGVLERKTFGKNTYYMLPF